MFREKSTKTNVAFFIYLFTIVFLLFFFFVLKNSQKVGELQITMKNQHCSFAEIYFNDENKISLEKEKSRRIQLDTSQKFATYTTTLPLPVKYLRFDPCEVREVVEVKSMEIVYNSQVVPIPLETMAQWICSGCTIQHTDSSNIITSLNNDPIVIATTIEDILSPLHVTDYQTEMKRILIGIIVVLLILPIVFSIAQSKRKYFLLAVFITLMFVFFLAKIGAKKDFEYVILNFFPDPMIGKERIVGYAQYFGFPLYAETLMFSIAFVSPFIIFSIFFCMPKLFERWLVKKIRGKKS